MRVHIYIYIYTWGPPGFHPVMPKKAYDVDDHRINESTNEWVSGFAPPPLPRGLWLCQLAAYTWGIRMRFVSLPNPLFIHSNPTPLISYDLVYLLASSHSPPRQICFPLHFIFIFVSHGILLFVQDFSGSWLLLNPIYREHSLIFMYIDDVLWFMYICYTIFVQFISYWI